MKKYCINQTKAVINIGGHTVIAPTKGDWVDPGVRGVQDLIDRKLLEESEPPADAGEGPRGKTDDDENKEPSTVPQLKAWLDEKQVTYPPDAKKPELLGLYEALKASAGQ